MVYSVVDSIVTRVGEPLGQSYSIGDHVRVRGLHVQFVVAPPATHMKAEKNTSNEKEEGTKYTTPRLRQPMHVRGWRRVVVLGVCVHV